MGKQSNWEEYEDVDGYFTLAASCGHFEMLKWLHEKGEIFNGVGTPFRTNAMGMAAYFGSLEMIKYLKEKGYSWDERTTAIDYAGNLDIFKWLIENECSWNGQDDGFNLVFYGNMENIIWGKWNYIS